MGQLLIRILNIFLTLILVGGCDRYSNNVPLERVDIIARNDANNNYATSVDLVIVFDKDLAGTISSMSAGEYFEKAEQIRLDNAENISVWHWEITPGQPIYKTNIKRNRAFPVAGFFFAHYYNKGTHRTKVPKVSSVRVILANDRFIVKPNKYE